MAAFGMSCLGLGFPFPGGFFLPAVLPLLAPLGLRRRRWPRAWSLFVGLLLFLNESCLAEVHRPSRITTFGMVADPVLDEVTHTLKNAQLGPVWEVYLF